MKISTFFEKYGEESFRNIESEMIKDVSKETSLVISTGGGAIWKGFYITCRCETIYTL